MFGPVRGLWPDESWRGSWGDEPPYHVDAFVLTHHARPALVMQGGTTFHFVTGGIEEALDRAKASAKGKSVRIGCETATMRQYLQAGLVDEMHLAQSGTLLGEGENLFTGLDLAKAGYRCKQRVTSDLATHLIYSRAG